jgi:cell wall-associated NlpC family hydrolase
MEHHIRTLTGMNFRKGPGTNYGVVATLKTGTVLHVLEIISGLSWYRAKLEDGTEGYISSKVIKVAASYLGTPYVFGSTRFNDKSFDCSDLCQFAMYKGAGIKISGDSRSQSKEGTEVKLEDLRTGDLIFFDTNADDIINHVALYVYPNQILHTYNTKADVFDAGNNLVQKGTGGVTYSPYVEGGYWRKKTTGARRIIQ